MGKMSRNQIPTLQLDRVKQLCQLTSIFIHLLKLSLKEIFLQFHIMKNNYL